MKSLFDLFAYSLVVQRCASFIADPRFQPKEYRVRNSQFSVLSLSRGRRSGAMARKRENEKAKGFKSNSSNVIQLKRDGDKIYSMPGLYDLAFGYRNFEFEVNFLQNAHRRFSSDKSSDEINILELAAGPARHAMTSIAMKESIVKKAVALDCSEEMEKYNKDLVLNELNEEQARAFEYCIGDMRELPFLDEQFNSVWILLGSMAHLKTNDDVIRCFKGIEKVLTSGGTCIVELPHPQETFSMIECTKNDWEVPIEDEEGVETTLSIVWGDDNDEFDPITQIRDFTVSLSLKNDENSEVIQEIKEKVPMRLFTAQEIDALARCAGLEMKAMFGALDEEMHVTADAAFRLVCVLGKI